MLTSLNIRNFAIIDSLELTIEDGFTVLTGETGAGKSILLDALDLVLGDRAEPGIVREGTNKAEITAEFDLAGQPTVIDWLRERDLDDDALCTARRVVTAEGRSRGYVNDRSVSMQLLRELGEQLVDIHGQHEHQSLLRRNEQLSLVDDYGDHGALLDDVRDSHVEWKIMHTQLQNLREAQANRDARLDLLRFQVGELESMELKENEMAGLENEHQRFQHANKLLENSQLALNAIYDDEHSTAHGLLGNALQKLKDAASRDEQLIETCTLLETSLINLDEAASNLRAYVDEFNPDPERRDWVETRIATLQQLARKHKTEPGKLAAIAHTLRHELDDLENAGERLEQLEEGVNALARKYTSFAEKLTTARNKTSKKLADEVTRAMQELGMPGGAFSIEVSEAENPYSTLGKDRVEFLVQPNPGQPMKPLRKVASGGELSRISLAIQVIASSSSSLFTMIFDEVDAGVGGGVAELVGRRLRSVATGRQVLCVTHLPQVASHAHHHCRVSKTATGKTTATAVHLLDQNERVEELARMLGGVEITDTTREHAREMIQSAANAA